MKRFLGLILLTTAVCLVALTAVSALDTPLSSPYDTLAGQSYYDQPTLWAALVTPGVVDTTLSIPVTRVQYAFQNTLGDAGSVFSFTVFYDESLGSKMIAAGTPLGYQDKFGNPTDLGGSPYDTLLNAGFGVYSYNIGCPWTIDWEADHTTFTASPTLAALPTGTSTFPSFDLEFDPSVSVGMVNAIAWPVGANEPCTGQVLGPVVPEPTALLGLVTGLIGCISLRRRVK